MYPYTGNQINTKGVVVVYYFGNMIALVDNIGEILWQDERFPLFLIEYLLQEPDRLTDIRRN